MRTKLWPHDSQTEWKGSVLISLSVGRVKRAVYIYCLKFLCQDQPSSQKLLSSSKYTIIKLKTYYES